MMTSRAEYRLLLRQDNADLRLTHYGYEAGLVSKEFYERVQKKQRLIDSETARMHETMVGAGAEILSFLERHESAPVKKSTSLAELICRPELTYEAVAELDPEREDIWKEYAADDRLKKEVIEQIDIQIKYEGYIRRQEAQVKQFKRMENRVIPEDIDYDKVESLRLEARQKLKSLRPANVGQASRIAGVSPADISVLLVYLSANGGV